MVNIKTQTIPEDVKASTEKEIMIVSQKMTVPFMCEPEKMKVLKVLWTKDIENYIKLGFDIDWTILWSAVNYGIMEGIRQERCRRRNKRC